MNYGDRLRLARKHKKLSQTALATISGVKQGTISKIERNEQNYSGFDAQLSDALDIHAMWLKTEEKKFAPDWLNNTSFDKIQELTSDYEQLPCQCPSIKVDRPPVIQEAAWQSFTPQVRALIEDILNKTHKGQLHQDHIKILQSMVDALTRE